MTASITHSFKSEVIDFVICFISFTSFSNALNAELPKDDNKMPLKLTLMNDWQKHVGVLHRNENVSERLECETAIYKWRGHRGGDRPVALVGFVNPKTGGLWLGKEAQFYVEYDSKIVGGSFPLGGRMEWYENLVPAVKSSAKGVASAKEYCGHLDGKVVLQPSDGVDLQVILNPSFFDVIPRSMQSASPKIDAVGVKDGILQLDLTSPTGVHHGRVWINLKTRKVTKAEEDGTVVFPRGS